MVLAPSCAARWPLRRTEGAVRPGQAADWAPMFAIRGPSPRISELAGLAGKTVGLMRQPSAGREGVLKDGGAVTDPATRRRPVDRLIQTKTNTMENRHRRPQ